MMLDNIVNVYIYISSHIKIYCIVLYCIVLCSLVFDVSFGKNTRVGRNISYSFFSNVVL
jgi:hypothetical protein